MNATTAEWIAKAEQDFASAQRESMVQIMPNNDLVCFLAEQVTERYLKAYLQEHNVPFRKTHNLEDLLNLCITADPSLESMRVAMKTLTQYAVDYRYPGAWALNDEAVAAMKFVIKVRQEIRAKLGI
jgi:HEPN domain-containing protein